MFCLVFSKAEPVYLSFDHVVVRLTHSMRKSRLLKVQRIIFYKYLYEMFFIVPQIFNNFTVFDDTFR